MGLLVAPGVAIAAAAPTQGSRGEQPRKAVIDTAIAEIKRAGLELKGDQAVVLGGGWRSCSRTWPWPPGSRSSARAIGTLSVEVQDIYVKEWRRLNRAERPRGSRRAE